MNETFDIVNVWLSVIVSPSHCVCGDFWQILWWIFWTYASVLWFAQWIICSSIDICSFARTLFQCRGKTWAKQIRRLSNKNRSIKQISPTKAAVTSEKWPNSLLNPLWYVLTYVCLVTYFLLFCLIQQRHSLSRSVNPGKVSDESGKITNTSATRLVWIPRFLFSNI